MLSLIDYHESGEQPGWNKLIERNWTQLNRSRDFIEM